MTLLFYVCQPKKISFGNRFATFSIGHCSFVGIFGRINISTFVSIAQTIHPNGKFVISTLFRSGEKIISPAVFSVLIFHSTAKVIFGSDLGRSFVGLNQSCISLNFIFYFEGRIFD